ncbi:hypothetical protein GCM10022224_007800 [Nonomuraea antimicrobica]|uniref:Secreted protein n=1 Tax=Nonomuraea antimicrobica TaxID=561173 RepID=A0ABP7B475_9ACTN
MMRTRTTSAAAAIASAALTLALAPAGTAHAAPAKAAPMTGPMTGAVTSASASAGTAPSCVHRKLLIRQGVMLTNKCGKTMKVKVLVKRGKDSWCFTMKNNQRRFWAFVPQAAFAKYEKTVTC